MQTWNGVLAQLAQLLLDGVLNERGDIQNEGNFTASQNGGAADPLQALEQLAKRLDDGLEFTQQLVDHQAGFLAAVADDHDVFPATSGALDIEIVLQPDKRQHFAAQIDVVAPLGIGQRALGQLHAFDHHVEGDDVVGRADAHQKTIDDGQSERQPDLDPGAEAGFAVEFDTATQGLDVAFDHIHAHPAAGEIGDGLRRGEAGFEDELVDLLIRQGGIGGDQAAFLRLLQDPGLVEAGAIVLNFDDDAAGVMVGVEFQAAAGILAVGGVLAWLILGSLVSPVIMAAIMAAVAGIMVALSVDELMPLAKEIDPNNNPSYGVLCGMSVMGLSLVLLQAAGIG